MKSERRQDLCAVHKRRWGYAKQTFHPTAVCRPGLDVRSWWKHDKVPTLATVAKSWDAFRRCHWSGAVRARDYLREANFHMATAAMMEGTDAERRAEWIDADERRFQEQYGHLLAYQDSLAYAGRCDWKC